MREKQLPVNETVFNALIMGHSNCDDLESAAGILGFMTQAGLQPSADTYTTLLCGFARTGDINSINKYVEQCERDEISLLDKDFLEVIYTLAVNGHEAKVDEVLPRIKKSYGYNQDAVNISLRLINRGQESTAMKLLETMHRGNRASGEQTDSGNFLIRQLVKANRPVEQILTICNEMESSNMNSKPLLIAVEAALAAGLTDTSKALLKEMKNKGAEVRQHYFWPIFCKAQSEQEVVDILTLMKNEFNLFPNGQTIRDYAIPKLLKNDDYAAVIQTLASYGLSPAKAAAETAIVACTNFHSAKAAEIMNSYDSYYTPGLFIKHLSNGLSRTNDFDSYIKIIRCIVDNLDRRNRNQNQKQEAVETEENEVEAIEANDTGNSLIQRQADVVGDFLMDALLFFKTNRVEVMENILQRLVDQGLSINSIKAQRIQDRLGEELTDKMSTLLGKLASGELEPIAVEKQRAPKLDPRSRTPEEWERVINKVNEKGGNSNAIKREWLISAIRLKDIAKTEEIVSQLKAEGYVLGNGVYAQMIELYALEDRPDDALALLRSLRETDPELTLDELKVLKVVHSLVNAERYDEAIKFVEENKAKELKEEKSFNHQNTCWRILNSMAEKGKAEELNKLFEALVASSIIFPNNSLLGPLIKVHLVKEDIKTAIDRFEEICQKYRATPWKNEIATRLIQAEDAVNLQRLTDISTEIHGEANSLYDLVFSFIECGRVRQARKILETPGLQTRQNRINHACERYLNESMPTALEGLIEATKDLNHIDRAEIYNSLLKTYIKEKAPEKGLELWTAMQEEGATPSDAFLIQLAKFLKTNGLEVPFHVPTQPGTAAEQVKTVKEASAKRIKQKTVKLDGVGKKSESSPRNTIVKTSKDIEELVKEEKLNEATKLVFQLLEEKAHPIPRIFRFYLNTLAKSGDSATIEKIGQFLTPEMKKEVSFDNRLSNSFIHSGKADEYLNKLESVIDDAKTPEELKALEEAFPRGGASGMIEAFPDLTPKFEQIATKYAEKQILGPMNVLWMHYVIKNDTRADDVFKQYMTHSPRLMFQRVLTKAREDQDEELALRLIKSLANAKVSEGAIGNVHSCLIDIYAAKDNADACLTAVTNSVKEVCLENINRTALMRAKACVEKAGKKFPHTIPDEKSSKKQDTSSSSSSSSSDDEVTRKEKTAA